MIARMGVARVWLHRLLVLACAVACDGPGVVSPRHAATLGSGTTAAAAGVVGTWQRTIFFIDDFGIARSSESTWQFTAGGAATRITVSRNLTFGLVDVQVAAGRYRLEGAQVIIDLVSPSPVQLQLAVRLVADQLELAGQLYLRVPG